MPTDLKLSPVSAKLVNSRTAVKLTGLSSEQLREWTVRRALIPADVRPKGHGSPARYSWQTILLLRLALVLRDRFKLELEAYRDVFGDVAGGLSKVSFRSLWGKSFAVHVDHRWSFIEPDELVTATDDCIVLRLDPHLSDLADTFSLSRPPVAEQYELFASTRAGLHVLTATAGRLR